MSTFLADGKILIKIRKRFMVFTTNGAFIDEAQFDDSILKDYVDDEVHPNNLGAHTTRHRDIVKSGLEILKERRKNDPILDFNGKEYQY